MFVAAAVAGVENTEKTLQPDMLVVTQAINAPRLQSHCRHEQEAVTRVR